MIKVIHTIIPLIKKEIETKTGYTFYSINGDIVLLENNSSLIAGNEPIGFSKDMAFSHISVEVTDTHALSQLTQLLSTKVYDVIDNMADTYSRKVTPSVGEMCILVSAMDVLNSECLYKVMEIDQGRCKLANIYGVKIVDIDEVAKVTINLLADNGDPLVTIDLV